jgi:vacuolar-type H+-ATPase subunit H
VPKERREVLEANTGVLKELAMREAQLSAKVAQAKEDALKIVSEAEAKAKELLHKCESDVQALEAEYKQKRESEEKSIFEAGVSAAKLAADSLKAAASGKIAGAVQQIVSKVLP